MATWKTYGAGVLVSSGLFITGILWYERPLPYITGEDLAELLAATSERQAVAYLTGTNQPSFTSNNVSAFIQWSQLYEGILLPTVAAATNQPTGLPAVWWLDSALPLPESGDMLISNGLSWVVTAMSTNTHPDGDQIVYKWGLVSNSNHIDMLPATSTRAYTDGSINFCAAYPTNWYPFGQFFHTDTNSIYGLSYDWTYGNWWTRIGLGTNVYKWGCETWHGLEGEDLTLTYLYGEGFSLATNRVHIPYGDTSYHPVNVASIGTATNRLLAALYSVDCPYKDTRYFAFSDASTTPTMNITLSDLTKEVTEGSTTTFTVKPSENPLGFSRIMTIAASGSVTVSPSVKIWTSNNWTSAETVTITATTNAVKGDSAGVVRIIYNNSANYIGVKVIDDDGAADGIKVDNSLFTVARGSTNAVSVGLVNVSTNFYISTVKWITSNNLNQARCAMTNLNRTIYICPASYLSFTNCAQNYAITNINWSVATNSEEVLPWVPYDQFSAMVADVIPSPVVTNGSWDGLLLNFRSHLSRWDLGSWYAAPGWFGTGAGWAYKWYADFGSTVMAKKMTGCRLPYPSDYAIASGLVSRVSVYAIAYHQTTAYDPLDIPFDIGYTLGEDDILISFALDGITPDPGAWDEINLGAIDKVSKTPALSANAFTESRYDGYGYTGPDASGLPFTGSRLSLVGVFTNGLGCTNFIFGTDAVSFPSTMPDYRYGHTQFESYDTVSEEPEVWDEKWEVSFERSLVVTHFVVIVDWNWQHMGMTPFEPATNSPAWAVVSTNSP